MTKWYSDHCLELPDNEKIRNHMLDWCHIYLGKPNVHPKDKENPAFAYAGFNENGKWGYAAFPHFSGYGIWFKSSDDKFLFVLTWYNELKNAV